MIRVVSTVSLVLVLMLVLYLPSAYSPERFIHQLRMEHGLTVGFWGHDAATRIMSRTLDLQTTVKEVGPVPSLTDTFAVSAIDQAVAKQMSHVNERLFNNPYFRSIDALLALATYRFSVLLESLPVLVLFMAPVLFDGYVLRIVKSKEFIQHHPERFALYACAAIIIACATVIAFVLPVTLSPFVLTLVPAVLSICVGRSIAHFHRRG